MASVDNFGSIYSTSDVIVDHVCGPCKSEGSEKEATKYCYDCQEYLCDSCLNHHRKLPITKNHKIASASDVPYSTGRRLTIHCGCNKKQEVEFYCERHAEAICKQCLNFGHQKCNTVTIQQKSSGYASTKLDSILSRTTSLKDKYDELKQSCIEEKKNLQKSKDVCKKEIQAFRKELDDYIDQLEQNMVKELDELETKEKSSIDQKITTLVTALQILDADENTLKDAKNDGRKHIMFAADAQSSKRFRDCERRLAELEKEAMKLNLSFERNKKLDDILIDNSNLGTLKLTETPLKTTLLGRQIKSRREVNVKLTSDKNDPEITGCVVMPNGHVVICDHNNDKIKLLDSSLEMKGSMNMPYPWDVSVVDANHVIVTLVGTKRLTVVQIFPSMKAGRVFQLDQMCCGVAVSGDSIFVTCHDGLGNGEVRVLDKLGTVKQRLGASSTGSILSSGPHYIAVSKAGNKIFVSDFSKDTVICLAMDGSTIYQYTDKDLNGPKGVYCDDADNVLVCGYGSNNVHVIEANGHKAGTLLSAKNDLKESISIAFRESDNILLVGHHEHNKLLVHNLVAT